MTPGRSLAVPSVERLFRTLAVAACVSLSAPALAGSEAAVPAAVEATVPAAVEATGAVVPEPVEAAVRTAPLDFEALLNPITRDAVYRSSRVGVDVVDVRTGESVFARGSTRGLVPASTAKVLTAAAALRALGPAHRFTTDVFADGPIDGTGVLHGNLYVKGHGDPRMVIEVLWKLVYDLKLEGITRVEGDVVFDEGYFDTEYALTGWDKELDVREGPSYFAPSSALSLNFNTVAVVVAPGPEPGKPARVLLETPASGYVTVRSDATTSAVGTSRNLELDRIVADDHMVFAVSGTVPADAGVKKYYRTVVDPTAYFMAAWTELETIHGIEVTGEHRRGTVPSTADLVHQHHSVPLTAILMDMNKYSNNFMAEQVLKAVGAETSDGPGSTAAGLDYVRGYLDTLGVERETYHLVNGSGLSRDATMPAALLTRVMVDMAHDEKVGHEFQTTLSIAGWDGTLNRRFEEDPARVRGKTGTINGVHCLTGYVTASDGNLYAFSFLVNELRGGTGRARRLHDRFLRRMFNADAP